MGEYTPSTALVRESYVGLHAETPGDDYGLYAEFDRWLRAEHARVWREGALWGIEEIEGDLSFHFVPSDNPYEGDPR